MDSNSPVFAPDVQDINRRREIAKALIKQGMSTPTETQYAGGAAVKNSPLIGIANLLVTALGKHKEKQADKDYSSALANALKGDMPAPMAAPQVAPVAPEGMAQMPPQPMPQPQGQPEMSMDQIMRMQQFPELKGYADIALKQMLAKQAADDAFKRAREGHKEDRKFDIENPTPEKPPASVAEYNFAKQNGFQGTFDQYQRQQRTPIQAPDRELVPVYGPDGQPVLIPRSQAAGKRPFSAAVAAGGGGAPGAPAMTKDQRAKLPVLDSLDYVAGRFRDAAKNVTTGGTFGLSGQLSGITDYQDVQKFNNAKEQLSTELRTIFRIPGEGALSDKEQAQYGIQLPSIKYDAATNEGIVNDIQNRARLRLGQPIQGGDGSGLQSPYPEGTAAPQGAPQRKRFNPATGMIE